MRRALIGLGAILLVVVGGDALVWRWAVGAVADQYALWVAQQRAAGWIVTSGEPAREGWPLAALLSLPQMRIAYAPAGEPAEGAWTAERVVLGVALPHPSTLTVSPEGRQTLRLGEGPETGFTAERLVATIPLAPGVPAREVNIAAANLRVAIAGATQPLTLALLSVNARTDPAAAQGEAVLSFAGSAQDIALPSPPPSHPWPLGPRIASVSLEARVNGPMPRAPDPVIKATGWRDGGGTLEIGRLAIGWGPLGLSGTATVALDERMQPMGTANAHIVGQAEALDALAANGAITQRTALAAKAVLSLMARPPQGGGAPAVDVPLTLQDRKLAMGRIPLAVLPELEWPNSP